MSGIGWMILDPTPSGSTTYPEDTEPGETVPGTTEPTQTTPTEESEITEPGETTETTEPTESTDETVPTESTGATEPTEITEATEPTDPAPTDPSESTSGDTSVETSSGASGPRQPPEEKPQARGWIIWLLVIVTGLLVLATVVVGQWLIRRRLRQKRLYRGNLNAQALAHYRLVQRLARVRKVRIPGHLKQLAEKACFSRSGITAGELPRFDAFIQESKIALEKESWVKKLYYRLVLAII